MQPVTISLRQAPVFLYSAISRMVSIDSCFALSMNAHVLTTRTSADSGSRVSWWPALCARPSMPSESTRFLRQPSDTMPIVITEERTTPSHLSSDYGKPCPARLRLRPSSVQLRLAGLEQCPFARPPGGRRRLDRRRFDSTP